MEKKALSALMKAIAPVLHEHVENRIAATVGPLLLRIAELELRPRGLMYEGVWSEGSVYGKDSGVTFDGSIFIALRKTSAKPGASPDWRLAVKRGRDGKDAPR